MHIAIVEDEAIIGELLKESLEKGGRRVDLYHSGAEALEKLPMAVPDAILMDINLPDASGIDLTRALKERYPAIEIVVQTVLEDTGTILQAIKAGASGYLLKASTPEEVEEALRVVTGGGSFLTGKVARKVLQEFQSPEKRETLPGGIKRFGLTQREDEILRGLVQGDSYKEIAHRYGLSFHTVNNHIRKIYEKLQVNSRAEAVAKAREG